MSIAEKFVTMEYGPAPEDPKEALAWLDAHRRRFGHFIDGAWRQPAGGRYFETTDPSTGEKIAAVAQGSAADIDAAVHAARQAFPTWQALTPHARARYLYALARTVQKHSRRLAVLETMDNGKPIRESRDIDIPLVARHFYHHAGWAQLLRVRSFPDTRRAASSDRSFPGIFRLLMLAWKIAPALATGNTVVLQAGGVHSAHRTCLRGNLLRDRTAAGCSQHRDRRRRRLAKRWSSIPTSTRSPSRARPKWDAQFAAPRRTAISGCRSNWAASRRSSFSKTPISTARSKAWSTGSGSTRDRSAAPVHAC